jgi:outer membrane scaffolding protein for murein synthesis (MipA/OmpV family)
MKTITTLALFISFVSLNILSCTPINSLKIHEPQVPATYPGLRNNDGSAHNIHTPNRAPRIINVVTRAAELGKTIDLSDSAISDEDAIMAVFKDAKTTRGSTVLFPAGVYNLRSISLVADGVNIEGEDPNATIFKSSLHNEGTLLNIEGKHDILIKNISFTSTWNGSYSTDTKTANPNLGGPKYMITTGGNAYKITIDNVMLEKFVRMGVRIGAGSHDVVVKNSLAKNATNVAGGGAGYGFVIQGSAHKDGTENPFLGDATQDTYFNVLENNRTQGPYIRHSVIVQYWAHHNLIRNNQFEDTQLDAIDLHGEDEYNNEVAHNTITGSVSAGIGLGNSGAGHDKTGVNNWIHSNTMIGCAQGITVQYGTIKSIIENNIIRDNNRMSKKPLCAICLGKSGDSLLRNNLIQNNSSPNYSGILLMDDKASGTEAVGGPTNWTMTGNKIIQSGTPFKDESEMDANNKIQTAWQ